MKITFEGKTIGEVLDQMQDMLTRVNKPLLAPIQANTAWTEAMAKIPAVQGPGPDVFAQPRVVDKPVDKPVSNPGKTSKQRTPKQLENDAKLRERALAKKAAGLKVGDKTPLPTPPPLKTAERMDPAEVVRIRQKTIEDLKQAYANGHKKQLTNLPPTLHNTAQTITE